MNKSTLEISTSGLNPSNRGAGFPNLAMGSVDKYYDEQPPDVQKDLDHVDETCKAELEAAGIDAVTLECLRTSNGEVPTKYLGEIPVGWGFSRNWYYWVAKGPGIPPKYAKELHAKEGKACRVEGHCGAPDPIEYCHGFAVGSYHVDTPEALKALADTIKQIRDEANA